jgi:hypothetical protein
LASIIGVAQHRCGTDPNPDLNILYSMYIIYILVVCDFLIGGEVWWKKR